MAATRLIALHVNKGKTVAQCLADRTDYSENAAKTNNGEFISSYECDPKTCDQEFLLAKREYLHKRGFDYKGNVIAYQIRQSFAPGEITPEEANAIGYETAMRWTKGKHAFIVATHVDRAHIHNHIIYNSTNLSCDRKYRDFWRSGKALQRVSDLICIEHGLSVIDPKPYSERAKRSKSQFAPSMRDDIRADIDKIISTNVNSFEELLKELEAKGYEIKRGKRVSIRRKDAKRFLRFDTFGEDYTVGKLTEMISGENPVLAKIRRDRKMSLVLDIQEIIAKNKGAGFERWAKRYNLKQTAKAICFLQEHGISGLTELQELADSTSKRFDGLAASLKQKQARLDVISELKQGIADYYRTKDVYAAYRESGFSAKFFEEHRADIQIHKAAKEVFNKQGVKKLPKIKDLNQEFSEILVAKKADYAEYKKVKEEMQELLIAKQNIETLLGSGDGGKEKSITEKTL